MKSLLKNAFARSSTTASLDVSSNVPDSGFAFISNSKGASASIVELSDALDDVLGDIELEGAFFYSCLAIGYLLTRGRRSKRVCQERGSTLR